MAALDVDQFRRAVSYLKSDIERILSDLVSFDSTRGSQGEKDIQAYLKVELESIDFQIEKVGVDEKVLKERYPQIWAPVDWDYKDRYNLHATLWPKSKNGKQGKSLLFNAHIDVVPVEKEAEKKWDSPPFKPLIKGDRLFGRGAGDMKGGLVSVLIALKALRSLNLRPNAPLMIQTVIEEECTGNGALACLNFLFDHKATIPFPQAVIVPEPLPGISSAHVGVMWLQIIVSGKPAHALDTSQGMNAIDGAIHLYQEALKPLETRWNDEKRKPKEYQGLVHPLNFNLGKIEGGVWSSSVPSDCTLHVRVGYFPGVLATAVQRDLDEALKVAATKKGIFYETKYIGFQAEGCVLETPDSKILFDNIREAHQRVVGTPLKSVPATCTTDARYYHLYGKIPSTCYGPAANSIHGINESVSLSSVQEVAIVFGRFIEQWCGLTRISNDEKSSKIKSSL